MKFAKKQRFNVLYLVNTHNTAYKDRSTKDIEVFLRLKLSCLDLSHSLLNFLVIRKMVLGQKLWKPPWRIVETKKIHSLFKPSISNQWKLSLQESEQNHSMALAVDFSSCNLQKKVRKINHFCFHYIIIVTFYSNSNK